MASSFTPALLFAFGLLLLGAGLAVAVLLGRRMRPSRADGGALAGGMLAVVVAAVGGRVLMSLCLVMTAQLYWASMLIGVPAGVAVLVLGLVWARRGPSWILRTGIAAAGAAAVTLLTVPGAAYALNRGADLSAGRTTGSVVLETFKRSSKGPLTYWVLLQNPVAGQDPVKWRVEEEVWRGLKAGAPAQLSIRDGALGFAWVGDVSF